MDASTWFECAIASDPETSLAFAKDVGKEVVQLRMQNELNEVVAARIDA
jgi:hypothetical protein